MITIYTVCYNTPNYIEYQYKLFKKFIADDFEYIVFNNTMTNKTLTKDNYKNNELLINVCKKYNITTFNLNVDNFKNIPDNDASMRAGTAIDASHKILFSKYSNDNIYFLIDSDAFILSPFNVENFMEHKKFSGRLQCRNNNNNNNVINYITNHIVIYKPSCLDDSFQENFSFMPCKIGNANCDCGGKISNILNKINKHDFVNWKNSLFSDKGHIEQIYGGSPSKDDDFDYNFLHTLDRNVKQFILDDTNKLQKKHPFCEIFSNDDNNVTFLHLRAGTNWIGYNFESREILLKQFIDLLLE